MTFVFDILVGSTLYVEAPDEKIALRMVRSHVGSASQVQGVELRETSLQQPPEVMQCVS